MAMSTIFHDTHSDVIPPEDSITRLLVSVKYAHLHIYELVEKKCLTVSLARCCFTGGQHTPPRAQVAVTNGNRGIGTGYTQ